MHEVRSTYIIQPTNCAHILCPAKFDSVKSYLTRNTHLDGAQNKGHKKKIKELGGNWPSQANDELSTVIDQQVCFGHPDRA